MPTIRDYHGSEGQLAVVRSGRWKFALGPTLQLFDLESDPRESKPVRNSALQRRLRGMAILFQEEMSRDARPAAYAGANRKAAFTATWQSQREFDRKRKKQWVTLSGFSRS